ncbi:heparan-alpha-glucosaminide N-acetyltransferase [Lutibaculum baratangense]|uniref:heparan-alpha-glucosaminide N-acetyltransferase n=1 Tax=Lutibaculum baratangense TaxID=1358440 RepID=UPI000687D61E|nr:heparan-alpha-glucosaminide N-acetyltransferase [Lutibaculum baratangense]
MANATLTEVPARGPRFALVDLVRGLAIIGVVIYHFAWDLDYFRYLAVDVASDPLWRGFARLLAGTFLALVGVSLALAHRRGFRKQAFLRRLAILVIAALAVTVATWLAFPENFVFFGILHAIALFSLLAIPFLRAPVWLVATTGAAILLLPLWVALPAFDSRWLAWIGMVATVPATNDYVPVFPWFGVTLIGLALARLALDTAVEERAAGWRPRLALSRGLVRTGRWTLVIYLLHQPVLLGILYPVSLVVPPSREAERAPFVGSCARTCVASGGEAAICERACGCSADAFAEQDLWSLLRRSDLTDDEQRRIGEITRGCYAEAVRASEGSDFDSGAD